jgi:hypothetical protein
MCGDYAARRGDTDVADSQQRVRRSAWLEDNRAPCPGVRRDLADPAIVRIKRYDSREAAQAAGAVAGVAELERVTEAASSGTAVSEAQPHFQVVAGPHLSGRCCPGRPGNPSWSSDSRGWQQNGGAGDRGDNAAGCIGEQFNDCLS